MLPWLTYRRARIARIDAEAEALIYALGDAAYSVARQREHQASSPGIAKDWNRVALAVAEKTGKRVGLDTSTRAAIDADFSTDRGGNPQPKPRDYSEIGQIEELNRILGAKPAPFRVLFVGDAPNRGMPARGTPAPIVGLTAIHGRGVEDSTSRPSNGVCSVVPGVRG